MKYLALFAAAAVISAPAYAADAVVYTEPVPMEAVSTFSWTGAYIGANAGYAWGKAPTQLDWYDDGIIYDAYDYKQNLNGFIGGVQAGYNWQFDQAVIGIETDIQGTSMKKSSWLVDHDANLETKINWLGTTRLRLGYVPTERMLLYVTGGVAYGGVKASLTDYYGFDTSTSKTKAGYAVGAGLEYALADNWTVKAEYLYADLGKIKHEVYNDGPDEVDIATHKFRMNTVRIGVNYKF